MLRASALCLIWILAVAAPSRVSAQTTIFSDGFEGAFPGSWTVGNDGGITSARWGDNSFTAYVGGWSAFCADNGSNTRTVYDNNLHTFMERRNVSLAGYSNALLSFRYRLNSESGFDHFTVNIRSQSGAWSQVFSASGNQWSQGWQHRQLDLSQWAGQSGLYVQFRFDSDGVVVPASPSGVWLDEVSLTASVSSSVSITVLNQNGNPRSGAIVQRYSAAYAYLDERPTNASGVATWSSMAPGTYNFEVYYEGQNPFNTTGEFWVSTTRAIAAGPNTFPLQRIWPYTAVYKIVREQDGWEVPAGAALAPVSHNKLFLVATIRNGTQAAQSVRVQTLLDRNHSAPWDYLSAWTGYLSVSALSTRDFTVPFIPNTAVTGTFSKAIQTETVPVGKTDAWNWGPAFHLLPLPGASTGNGAINAFGRVWTKIDWAWQSSLGLSAANASFDGTEMSLRVSDGSGVGSQVEAQGAGFHYGDYTARIKAVPGTNCPRGVTQGFFYYLSDPPNASEIDVEILSTEPGYVRYVVHGGATSQQFRVAVPNQSSAYHEYGFRWRPGRVEFLLDGVVPQGVIVGGGGGNNCSGWTPGATVPAVATANVPSQPGRLIVNHWSGSPGWSGVAPLGAGDLVMRVQDVTYLPWQCYADCDSSGALNVADFSCFLQRFAAGCASPINCYANCDGSGVAPFLNVADFACFLQRFAAGCP
ncbi:MAG: family 16 glycosylhydrolase [Phycisphaerales bacterium]